MPRDEFELPHQLSVRSHIVRHRRKRSNLRAPRAGSIAANTLEPRELQEKLNLTELWFCSILLSNLIWAAKNGGSIKEPVNGGDGAHCFQRTDRGIPALEVRGFLRRYRLTDFFIVAAEDALVLSPRTATIL